MFFKKQEKINIPFNKIFHSIILSQLSYLSDIKEIIKESNKYDINLSDKNIFFYNNQIKDAQAFMYIDNNIIYLTFRGTESLKDVYFDIDIRRHKLDNGCKIHNGFFEQFNCLKSQIINDINNHINEINEINITGHSLGGALATIASAYFGDIYKSNNIKINCYTFGSPRVGNYKFVEWFQSCVDENWRICNNSDPIPSLPISYRFYHVNNKINLKNNKYEYSQTDNIYIKRLLSSIFKLNINEHFTNKYIERIKSLM